MRSPSLRFKDNLAEARQLLAIHNALTGPGPGRRHHVAVLNKSAILFTCAAFEAFIEDLAGYAFDHILDKTTDPTRLPLLLRKRIAASIKDDKHELKPWELAGDGWKAVAKTHKANMRSKYLGPFNTPKPDNIEELFAHLIGFENSSAGWKWPKVSVATAKDKLTQFVKLRGSLAHGEQPPPTVRKKHVRSYITFLAILSVRMANDVRSYCFDCTGEHPWDTVYYNKIK